MSDDQEEATSARPKIGWRYFADAMKKCIVFSGRASRAEFWWYCICLIAILILVRLISERFFGNYRLQNIISLAFILPSITVSWRRMHDVGKPGGYFLIPICNIILAATKGATGPNNYGPEPH